jgi:broad specificity phosphatase PhoE
MSSLLFITHPEVVIDPAVPVPEWPLSARGRERMQLFARGKAVASLRTVVSSAERKAIDGAEILGSALGLSPLVDAELGENDRSSTGYIAPPEFWQVVDAFFARPTESIRGWERAVDAQDRILRAVTRIAHGDWPGDIGIVAHGGVGTLLLAHLTKVPNARACAQPHGGGGCYFAIDRQSLTLKHGWRVLEDDGADGPALTRHEA